MAKKRKKSEREEIKKEIRRLRRIEKKQIKERTLLKQVRKKRTVQAKVSRGLAGFFKTARKGVTQSLYERGQPQIPIKKGRVKAGRGRPRGTVKYRHPETGQPIGVYEYRKLLRRDIAIQKAQARRQAEVSPQEKVVLQRFQRQKEIQEMSPERKPIPDTFGNVFLDGIMKEINDSANLVN